MYDKNYEEYMSSVLGYNVNRENTYYNNDYYDDFSNELEKNYPELYGGLIEKINEIDIQNCKNNLDKQIDGIYNELKIKETIKDMKNIILDLLKILVIKEKIIERQSEFQSRGIYTSRNVRNYNPYLDL